MGRHWGCCFSPGRAPFARPAPPWFVLLCGVCAPSMCIIIRTVPIFARYFCKNIQPESFFPWNSQNRDGSAPRSCGSLHGGPCINIRYAVNMQHIAAGRIISLESFFPWNSQNRDGSAPRSCGSLHGGPCINIRYAVNMQHIAAGRIISLRGSRWSRWGSHTPACPQAPAGGTARPGP